MSTQPIPHSRQPVELIEYGDFSCQRCRDWQGVLSTVLQLFDGEVVYTFRYFPDLAQPSALLMATVAEAARRQHRYWPMHRALFEQALPFTRPDALVLAIELGLQPEQFLDDLNDKQLEQRIRADIDRGHTIDVIATPTLMLGSRQLRGRLTQARIAPLIRHYLNRSASRAMRLVDVATGRLHGSETERPEPTIY